MIEKNIVKTVRFKEAELEAIAEFLKENSALDFSTLVRLAVLKFITSPSLKSLKIEKRENERIQQ